MIERKIPKKNYFILGLIILVSLLLVVYFYMWYLAYEENELGSPIANRYLQVINYNELDEYLVENKNFVIYVSILEDEKIREFEKNFRGYVNRNHLKDSILYLELTDELDLFGSIDISSYKITSKNVPLLLVYSDGELIDTYNIKDNDYDIGNIDEYLESKGIIND